MVQLDIKASEAHGLFIALFRLDPSFVMTPLPPIPTRTPTGFWGLNPKSVRQWFWGHAQTTKTLGEAYISTTFSSWSRHVSSSSSYVSIWLGQPLSWLSQHGLLLHMYSCSLMSLSVNHPWSVFDILVPQSKPHVCSLLLLVYRHDTSSLDLSCVVHRSSLFSTPAQQHSQEIRCTCTHAMVSLQAQPKPWSSLDNHSSQIWHIRAHINLVFVIYLKQCCVFVWKRHQNKIHTYWTRVLKIIQQRVHTVHDIRSCFNLWTYHR